MKKWFILSSFVFLILLLSGCDGQKDKDEESDQNEDDQTNQVETLVEEVKDTVSFYLVNVMPEGSTLPEGSMVTGCNDSYLVLEHRELESGVEGNVITALNTLFETELPAGGKAMPTGLTINATQNSNLRASWESHPQGGPELINLMGEVSIAGTCDTPRFKDQIEKTVGYYSDDEDGRYTILLNGDPKAWECLGDMSGQCK